MTGSDTPHYFLLAQATNSLRRASDRVALAAAGVTTAQAGALFAIAATDAPTQREIGAVLGLGEAAVTGLVTRLATMGLVRREADGADRRARRIHLTDAGRAALEAIEPARRALNRRVDEILGPDADRVAAALARLAKADLHDG